MFCHPLIAPANKCADRRRRGVKDVNVIVFDDFPETIRLGPVRCALVHNSRRAIRERTINNVTMTGDPADIGGAPKDIFIANVEDVLHC